MGIEFEPAVDAGGDHEVADYVSESRCSDNDGKLGWSYLAIAECAQEQRQSRSDDPSKVSQPQILLAAVVNAFLL